MLRYLLDNVYKTPAEVNIRGYKGGTLWHIYVEMMGNRDWSDTEPPLLKLLLNYPAFDLEAKNAEDNRPIDLLEHRSRGGLFYNRLQQEMNRRLAEAASKGAIS